MATHIHKVIEALGYSTKEAKVYLATLALGEAHISDIATKVKLPRTSVQAIVDHLHVDGLVNFYVTRRYKYWVAENPERLLTMLQERQQAITSVLPKLIEIRKQGRKGRAAHTISKEDLGAIRAVADEMVQAVLVTDEDESIVYVNAKWEDLFGYALAEVFGQTPRICQSGETPRAVYQEMQQILKQGKLFQTDQIIDRDKDGNTFSLCTSIFSLRHRGKLFYVQILETVTSVASSQTVHRTFLSALLAMTTVLSCVTIDVSPITQVIF